MRGQRLQAAEVELKRLREEQACSGQDGGEAGAADQAGGAPRVWAVGRR